MSIQPVRRVAPVGAVWGLGIALAIEFVGTALLATLLSMIRVATDASGYVGSSDSMTAAFLVSVLAASGALLALAHGAHLNPLLTLAAWFDGRRFRHNGRIVFAYFAAQGAGAFVAVIAIDPMIGRQLTAVGTPATAWLVGTEFVSATGLVALFMIFTTASRGSSTAAALGGYLDVITVVGWSYSFANPALVLATLPHTSWEDGTTDTAVVVLTALFGGGFIGAQYFTDQTSGGFDPRREQR
ncbi:MULTISPECIES: aquaporin [Nocardia]|jgi:glycerol uptake facilitator-like aquaporin|uniref:Major intrinsic protein n=1 Tax=Nocardia ignorata TaxID=145285 RepID=A0A4R6PNV4_NOCIG|nr:MULTISPECIES: aquaporin [Nocardia]MBC7302084.1 aquaporin [Nocardia sp.]TDP38549.1 major intrinsic protein [Nocardia ignorata]